MADPYKLLWNWDQQTADYWEDDVGYWENPPEEAYYNENYDYQYLESDASASYPEEAYDWTWDEGTYNYPTTIDASGTEYITGQSDLSVQARDHDAYQGMQGLEPGSPEEEASFLEYHPPVPWTQQLREGIGDAAHSTREFLEGLTGIPTGDIAKIAGYFMPRQGGKGVQQTRSSFQGPQRRQLPTASLRGKPQMSAAGRSPTTDEVIKTMIASNRTASTAANSARSQTSQGQAAIFKNLTDKLEEYGEASTGATKPAGPNIPQSEIRLTPRREIT